MLVYLRSRPEDLVRKLSMRRRPGEERITLEYLVHLHDKHEKWLIQRNYDEQRPILIIEPEIWSGQVHETYLKLLPYLEGTQLLKSNQTVTLL